MTDTKVEYKAPVYSGPPIGTIVTSAEQIKALPQGTVIAEVRQSANAVAYRYERPDGRHWQHLYQGGLHTAQTVWDAWAKSSPFVVESLGIDLPETVEQFGARLRGQMVRAEERARSTSNIADAVFRDVGVQFRASVGMRIINYTDLRKLQVEGTRVYTGSPETDDFAVWEWSEAGWQLKSGKGQDPQSAWSVVIESLPDRTEPDEWFTKEPTEEDPFQIATLRAKVWNRGWKEKVGRGWCGEYENIMTQGGLTMESAQLPLPAGAVFGQAVNVEQAYAQAIGTTFKVNNEAGELLAVFVRDARSRNRAGTRRAWARKEWKGGHFAEKMIVVSTPTRVPTPGPDGRFDTLVRVGRLIPELPWDKELDSLPVGTRIVNDERPGLRNPCYQKVEDGGWGVAGRFGDPEEPTVAQYVSGNFSDSYWYLRIGGAK